VITGIGAEPGHHEHRSPSTRLPTLASGWRSIVRMSIARLDRQPGQCTSSHGMPAITAQRIVGDHSEGILSKRLGESPRGVARSVADLVPFALQQRIQPVHLLANVRIEVA
jgi:hypothetical protein